MLFTPVDDSRSEFRDIAPNTWPRWEYAVATAAVVVICVLRVGLPVPSGNELTYLMGLQHYADPSYLPGDWTFGSGFDEHFIWLRVFAPLANLFGIEVLGWAGRLVLWTSVVVLLVWIGRQLGARPMFTGLAVVLWLGLDQSMGVGASRIVSGFEPSTVAYPILLGAMVLALSRKVEFALLAGGLAFSFHPGIGLWGSGALALTLLTIPDTRSKAWRSIWLLIVGALPGAVPQVLSLTRSNLTPDDAAFLALQRVPHHVDPFSFGQRGPLLLVLMLAFNLLLHWRLREEFPQRLLGWIQVFALVPVLLGIVARLLGQTWFLILFPFRLLPVLVPALFMINLGALLSRRQLALLWPGGRGAAQDRLRGVFGLAAAAGALVLWNPIVGLATDISENLEIWQAADTDAEIALAWVATGTPADGVVLGPPAREDLFYLTERSQYVSWEAIPYDRVPEWRRRLESVMPPGFVPAATQGREWEEQFAELQLERLLSLTPRVDYVITTADYDLPVMFTKGAWTVYRVTAP